MSDDDYVFFDDRSSNGVFWEQITFSAAALAPYVSGTQTYTLDLIDNGDPGWGWIGLDTVAIPGAEALEAAVPEPSAYALGLIGLAGLGLIAWRRRK